MPDYSVVLNVRVKPLYGITFIILYGTTFYYLSETLQKVEI